MVVVAAAVPGTRPRSELEREADCTYVPTLVENRIKGYGTLPIHDETFSGQFLRTLNVYTSSMLTHLPTMFTNPFCQCLYTLFLDQTKNAPHYFLGIGVPCYVEA